MPWPAFRRIDVIHPGRLRALGVQHWPTRRRGRSAAAAETGSVGPPRSVVSVVLILELARLVWRMHGPDEGVLVDTPKSTSTR